MKPITDSLYWCEAFSGSKHTSCKTTLRAPSLDTLGVLLRGGGVQRNSYKTILQGTVQHSAAVQHSVVGTTTVSGIAGSFTSPRGVTQVRDYVQRAGIFSSWMILAYRVIGMRRSKDRSHFQYIANCC